MTNDEDRKDPIMEPTVMAFRHTVFSFMLLTLIHGNVLFDRGPDPSILRF